MQPDLPNLDPGIRVGLAPGTQLAQYRIIRQVGVGGMGVVYLARDIELDRDVALKLLRTDVISADAAGPFHERFIREARSAARLSHPNVGSIFQIGRQESLVFISMEWLDGGSLLDYLRQNICLDWRDATSAIRDSAAGLAAAHDAGLIHRDIKPSNLMRTRAGLVKLVDFGLARDFTTESELTQTGSILGTPTYLSPEQCRGEKATPLSDIYGLACTWFHLLTSRPPFHADSLPGMLYQHQHEPLPDPRRFAEDVPEGVRRILSRAAAKNPADRHPTAGALLEDLNTLLDPRLARAPQPHTVLASPQTSTPAELVETQATQPPTEKRRFPLRSLGLTIVLLGVMLAVGWHQGWFVLTRERTKPIEPRPAASVTTNPQTPITPVGMPVAGRTFTNALGMNFVRIEPGTFMMGSPPTEESRGVDEVLHQVTLTRPFYLGAIKVTQRQWETVMKSNPSHFRGDDLPVDQASWEDAMTFCRLLSAAEGRSYRLPTEAEWEYAARAGTSTPFGIGARINTDQANYNGDFTYGDGPKGVNRQQTTPGRFFNLANAWGLFDMQGNLVEWTNDFYSGYPSSPVIDPRGPPTGVERVTRNGSWFGNPRFSRAASRSRCAADVHTDRIGIRVVLDAESRSATTTPASMPSAGRHDRLNSIGMRLVRIEPGTFTMGSPANEPGRGDDENQHAVTLTRAFYLGVTEVTQAQWRAITGDSPGYFKGDNLPVECVSWDESVAFCKKLSLKEGRTYRMPTEAEWEYAARAGTTSAFPTGAALQPSEANFNGEQPYPGSAAGTNRRQTTAVGSFPMSSAWGLSDMQGNLWEWCADDYARYAAGPLTDPMQSVAGVNHVARGGSFVGGARFCRSAARGQSAHDAHFYNFGLRVAMDAAGDQ